MVYFDNSIIDLSTKFWYRSLSFYYLSRTGKILWYYSTRIVAKKLIKLIHIYSILFWNLTVQWKKNNPRLRNMHMYKVYI